jgi:hypothetical protein
VRRVGGALASTSVPAWPLAHRKGTGVDPYGSGTTGSQTEMSVVALIRVLAFFFRPE